jgi:hypothetical protein
VRYYIDMIYASVLAAHLLTAAVTGVVIFFGLFAAIRSKSGWYKNLALALGFVAALEVMTGTVLAFVSPNISAFSLTLHIGEYLGVCVAVEAILFARMKAGMLAFPLKAAASPVVASILVFAAAIAYGV